jgi:integrase
MTIRVSLIKRSGRRCLEARWIDPLTGKKRTRSTGHTIRRNAERAAALLEEQLNRGGLPSEPRLTWAELRRAYQTEVFPALAPKSRRKTIGSLDRFDAEIGPQFVAAITTDVVRQFRRRLQQTDDEGRGLSLFTVRGHLAELRKVLRWAHRQGLLASVPHVEFPRCTGGMKGRPVTTEEFERLLAAVPAVVGEAAAASWQHLLRGLWLSGLRLGEALALHWTDPRQITIEWSGRFPQLRIQAEAQKSRKFQLLPLVDDFAAFLQETPAEARRGFVFRPAALRGDGDVLRSVDRVGKILTRIGAKAGVKVGASKCASAHDLRRSFGFRWAQHVMPQHLKELMRHADIKTTEQFYLGANADATAEAVRRALRRDAGNTFGNNGHDGDTQSAVMSSETL